MADSVLDKLTASNIFDLRGVGAVVTGGGTVGLLYLPSAIDDIEVITDGVI